MPRRLASLPPELVSTSFALPHSDRLGVRRKRTRGVDLNVPSRGIRLPSQPALSPAAALRGYTELDPSVILVDLSAAEIWGAPLPFWIRTSAEVRLARPRGSGQPRRRRVSGRKLSFAPDEVVETDGARVTSPARTFLDLAELLPLHDLVAVGDYFVNEHPEAHPHPKTPLCATADLRRVVAAHPGKRGVKNARAALDLTRVGADSPQETFLRLALIDHGLPEPVLNHSLDLPWRGPCVWPDLAYPVWRISLQYDGETHRDPAQFRRDFERQRLTEEAGWREVRIGYGDLKGSRPFAVARVREALLEAGWEPPTPRRNT